MWCRGSGCKLVIVASNGSGPEATAARQPPAIPGYDWSKHSWAFGVDAEKCIGCLRRRGVQAENDVSMDPHHFRTWVERYVTLQGEDNAQIDSQADPVNIAASTEEEDIVSPTDTKMQTSKKPSSCRSCAINVRILPVAGCPTGATYKTEDGVVLIDHTYCIGCRYCVQACPYGVRFLMSAETSAINAPGVTTVSPDCNRLVSRLVQLVPAFLVTAMTNKAR
jgi:Fe-S-cluster-containing dehydrogenase component